MTQATLGVDIGTSSSKGVLVDRDGRILATATREHAVDRPRVGHVEMDGEVWWDEAVAIVRDLLSAAPDASVESVGVSGMGPCVLLADEHDVPVRPAILYGVDTRASAQIARLDDELGADAVLRRGGSALTSQAAGPKIAWVAEHEPEAYARARRLFMPSSWLVRRLTGAYVLDHHSASQASPLYDTDALAWHEPWAHHVAPGIALPRLVWPSDVVGTVSPEASAATGLPAGVPVVAGTIDAWSEAVSVDAQNVGDLMLMYGTTMFLINTLADRVTTPSMWGPVGAFPGTRCLAGGMATSGAITSWLRDLVGGTPYPQLVAEAEASGLGAHGLLMLPYFAGERTPILDPDARGLVAGLTLSHTRGDLYRAALEATAYGVRHNVETILDAGGDVRRVVAVGGGTQGALWTQIVTDVTGLDQVVPRQTIGASYGAAYLAACATGEADIATWNPPETVLRPDPARHEEYSTLFALYRDAYPATRELTHRLADRQRTSDQRPNDRRTTEKGTA
ncbi:xylulokinase [Mumia flava]|uniref:Xylulokinase n=1 Tax=Mumia flava TaxID=1348852 RepID=A0A0B2BEW1_9ACTN|nr:FGGY-family carbohydrate kinase [Mumia flava]PJJ53717.1 xylulokinase [Mumia flava]